MFLIDHGNRQMGLTVGYRFDAFIGDDTGTRALGEARDDLQAGDVVAAVGTVLYGLDQVLVRKCQPSNDAAERFLRAPKPDLQVTP